MIKSESVTGVISLFYRGKQKWVQIPTSQNNKIMEENIAEFYLEQLKDTKNPVGVLVNFYVTLFNIDKADENIYKTFARLYRIYGRELIYFALLDCSDIDVIGDISRLISYFAKKRLEEKYNYKPLNDLSGLSSKLNRKRKTKISVKNPFEENIVE